MLLICGEVKHQKCMEYLCKIWKDIQAKQLKINVTKISSFLKDSNNTYIGLNKKNSALISRQEKRKQKWRKTVKEET